MPTWRSGASRSAEPKQGTRSRGTRSAGLASQEWDSWPRNVSPGSRDDGESGPGSRIDCDSRERATSSGRANHHLVHQSTPPRGAVRLPLRPLLSPPGRLLDSCLATRAWPLACGRVRPDSYRSCAPSAKTRQTRDWQSKVGTWSPGDQRIVRSIQSTRAPLNDAGGPITPHDDYAR